MARTNLKWVRVYADGYDLSGYARNIGPLAQEHEFGQFTAMSDEVVNGLVNSGMISPGTLDGVFDNTATSGLHNVLTSAGIIRDVMVAVGFQAVPASGDPVFVGQFSQGDYMAVPDEPVVTASIAFGPTDYRATTKSYDKAWGNLLHAHGAETGANSADASDHDYGSQTTAGGYMMYQVFAGNGTATIDVEDSTAESNASYSQLITSGSIDCSSVQSGIVALSTNATVERYTRWQLTPGTATTVTFALAFVRG